MTQGLFDFQGPFDFRALATPACGLTDGHRAHARAIGAGHYTAMHTQDRAYLESHHDIHDGLYFDAVGLPVALDAWDNRLAPRAPR